MEQELTELPTTMAVLRLFESKGQDVALQSSRPQWLRLISLMFSSTTVFCGMFLCKIKWVSEQQCTLQSTDRTLYA